MQDEQRTLDTQYHNAYTSQLNVPWGSTGVYGGPNASGLMRPPGSRYADDVATLAAEQSSVLTTATPEQCYGL
jgi:hypothetical protein